MKLYYLIIFSFSILLGTYQSAIAQESVVAGGGEGAGNSGTVSFTIGQIDYLHLSESRGDVRQGMQQPILAKKEIIPKKEVVMHLFPNPTSDFIFLSILDMDIANTSFILTDLGGKTLQQAKVLGAQTKIDMKTYDNAPYILTIYDQKKAIKTFKVILLK